jgi:integrase
MIVSPVATPLEACSVCRARFQMMSPEEYSGLQWKDVDFDEGTMTIVRAMLFNRKGGGWSFKESKTAQSKRTIPIPAYLVGQLKRHRTGTA